MSIKSTQSKFLLGLLGSVSWTGTAQAQGPFDYSCANDYTVYERSATNPTIGTDSNPKLTVHRNTTQVYFTTDGQHALQYIGTPVNGGDGSDGSVLHSAGDGGTGIDGDSVVLINCAKLQTAGKGSYGIYLYTPGGNGGTGGEGDAVRDGASGGAGGNGGNLNVQANSVSFIQTTGDLSHGIYAYTKGGNGGSGGDDSWISGGNGAIGGNGGNIYIDNDGQITTQGTGANGIMARSEGGQAGRGTAGFFGSDGRGGAGGNAGSEINGNNFGAITTLGHDSNAILLESIGGQGGDQ